MYGQDQHIAWDAEQGRVDSIDVCMKGTEFHWEGEHQDPREKMQGRTRILGEECQDHQAKRMDLASENKMFCVPEAATCALN
jgi:hypothetical protein